MSNVKQAIFAKKVTHKYVPGSNQYLAMRVKNISNGNNGSL